MKQGLKTILAVALVAAAFSGQARADVAKAKLPVVVYGKGATALPYIASGYMGNTEAIKIDFNCKDQPHEGAACMEVDYTASDNWGGVVWQSPANDWGDKPGGLDLTGAKKLSFWARGSTGGEKVNFSFGLLGKSKKYPDSAKGNTSVTLTTDWKQYSIDLAGDDLSCIKTGFCWIVNGAGHPTKFYLDDIEYD